MDRFVANLSRVAKNRSRDYKPPQLACGEEIAQGVSVQQLTRLGTVSRSQFLKTSFLAGPNPILSFSEAIRRVGSVSPIAYSLRDFQSPVYPWSSVLR
jgi:hypothetical protein